MITLQEFIIKSNIMITIILADSSIYTTEHIEFLPSKTGMYIKFVDYTSGDLEQINCELLDIIV